MIRLAVLFLAWFSLTIAAPAAQAQDSPWQLRLRGIGVIPDDRSTVNIGGDADVGDALTPEFDITYFITDKIGAELILATAEHQVDYTGNVNLGDTMILPPTLTLQYHPMRKSGDFSPYFGAGLNYSIFYGESAGTGFTNLEIDGGLGYALQAGFDYWLGDHWGINADVKKVWLDIDARLNNGTIRADVDLDPWIIGAGVSYRF
ncbi:MAG: OmpW family protein [Proteobacteria bacterium]|nr:OmpW family protein [Pseudomonadota bacterium]